MFCTNCGTANDDAAKFCSNCGTTLSETGTAASGTDEDFYKAVIGPNGQDYYLSKFKEFDANGKAGATWHWPSFFITFFWFLYRKMWLSAVIYFFLPYLVLFSLGILAVAAGNAAGSVIGIGYLLYLGGILVVPPLYANAFYYKHCKKKIAAAKASSPDVQRQLGELAARGGTSNVALIVVLVFVVLVFGVGILAAISIPAYQDYVTKSKVFEAKAAGNSAALSVAAYYQDHQQAPSSLEEAGFSGSLPPAVREMRVNGRTGVISVTLADGVVRGKTLFLVPVIGSDNKITGWKCESEDIQDRYLPKDCKRQR